MRVTVLVVGQPETLLDLRTFPPGEEQHLDPERVRDLPVSPASQPAAQFAQRQRQAVERFDLYAPRLLVLNGHPDRDDGARPHATQASVRSQAAPSETHGGTAAAPFHGCGTGRRPGSAAQLAHARLPARDCPMQGRRS